MICSFVCSCAEHSETSVSTAASAFAMRHDMQDNRQQACPFPAGVVSLVFGEVKHIVHLIRWNLKAVLCRLGQDLNTGLEWHNARTLGLGAESCCLTNCFGFLVCHQLVPHLVPNFPGVPLRNVSWGLGVCAVLVRSVSPCRLVLEVRLFPSPPCACSGRLPVVCPLFSSSCLSGLTRLWPGVCVTSKQM